MSENKIVLTNLLPEEIVSELARIKPAEVLGPIKKEKVLPFQIVPEEKIDLPEEILSLYPCTPSLLRQYIYQSRPLLSLE